MTFHWLILFVTFTSQWTKPFCHGNEATLISVLEHPSSLLLPVNSTATLSCTAICVDRSCSGYWTINHIYSIPPEFNDRSNDWIDSEITLELDVVASLAVNNTVVQCGFNGIGDNREHEDTLPATLLVLTERPLISNPQVEVNKSLILLQWSPPYLWPGFAIQYYNVSVQNSAYGNITYYKLNSTFSDSVVSFRKDIQEALMCAEIMITINVTAIGRAQLLLHNSTASFSITEWITPPSFTGDVDINICVRFKSDGTLALVEVNIQLPELSCNEIYLNYTYTLVVTNDRDDDNILILGPFDYTRNGLIKQNIAESLTEDQNYTLQILVDTCPIAQTFTSQKHNFSTYANWTVLLQTTIAGLDTNDGITTLNSILMSIALSSVLVTISVLSIGLYMHCRRKRAEWRAQEIRRRLRSGKNDMTINPIYDGTEGEHYYDHIPAGVAQQPQYVSLVNNQLITEEVLSKIQNGDESVQESAAAGNEYQVYHMTSKPQVTKSKNGKDESDSAVHSSVDCDIDVDEEQSYGILAPTTTAFVSSGAHSL